MCKTLCWPNQNHVLPFLTKTKRIARYVIQSTDQRDIKQFHSISFSQFTETWHDQPLIVKAFQKFHYWTDNEMLLGATEQSAKLINAENETEILFPKTCRIIWSSNRFFCDIMIWSVAEHKCIFDWCGECTFCFTIDRGSWEKIDPSKSERYENIKRRHIRVFSEVCSFALVRIATFVAVQLLFSE